MSNISVTETPQLLHQIEWPSGAFVKSSNNSDLSRYIKFNIGHVPLLCLYFGSVRWMVDAYLAFSSWEPSHIPKSLAEMLNLVVAQDNSCRYCYGVVRAEMKVMGFNDSQIQEIETNLQNASLNPYEFAALQFARKVSRCVPRPGTQDFSDLYKAGHTDESIAELTFIVAVNCYLNRLASLLAIPMDPFERMTESFIGRILRPMFRWQIQKMKSKWIQQDAPPNIDLPFFSAFSPLEKIRAGAILRKIIFDAWNSPILSKRSKSLAIAVIAKTIGCESCEAAARHLLQINGFSEPEIVSVLTHLSSEQLDSFDSALIRFSRATVRYQISHLHALCREFYAGLTDEQIIEIAGLASIANCLTRVTILSPK